MLIVFQHILLFLDLVVNSIFFLFLHNKILLLVLAVLQDIGLILSITLYFASFINTSYFKAGFLLPLLRRFWLSLFITTIYAVLSLVFQAIFLSHTLNRTDGYNNSWSSLIQVFYVLQRSTAVLFYYIYKRTSTCVCNPKFYNSELLFGQS